MRADANVVADLDLIVELYAFLDDGVADCAAIDRRVGADFDISAHLHPAQLRDFDPCAALGRKAKAITAEHRPRMDQHSGTECDALKQRHAGDQPHILGDTCARGDEAVRANECARTDGSACANDCACCDVGTGIDARSGVNDGGRMHSGGHCGLRVQPRRDARVGCVRIFAHEGCDRTIRDDGGLDNDDGGTRVRELAPVARVGEKGDRAS